MARHFQKPLQAGSSFWELRVTFGNSVQNPGRTLVDIISRKSASDLNELRSRFFPVRLPDENPALDNTLQLCVTQSRELLSIC